MDARIAPPRFVGAACGPINDKRVQRETIYARRRLQAIFGALLLASLGLVAHTHGADTLAVGLGVLGVVAAGVLVRRPRLEIRPDGLTVVNLTRTYRLPWTDIAGFGFGSARMTSCLAIRRRNGMTVNAVVVTDDVRSGYSSQRVAEIVAGLQERLVAATESGVAREPEFVLEPRARRNSLRLMNAMWLLVSAFFVIFGLVTAWQAAFGLPATYSRLGSHGVRATATFAGCRVTGIRDHECRLSLAYRGKTRTWRYREDFAQFDGLLVGAVVPVLVDPAHTTTVYTVHDVEERYNAGFGVLGIFGIVLAGVGGAGLAMYLRSRRYRTQS